MFHLCHACGSLTSWNLLIRRWLIEWIIFVAMFCGFLKHVFFFPTCGATLNYITVIDILVTVTSFNLIIDIDMHLIVGNTNGVDPSKYESRHPWWKSGMFLLDSSLLLFANTDNFKWSIVSHCLPVIWVILIMFVPLLVGSFFHCLRKTLIKNDGACYILILCQDPTM